jgi:hypothetical protein
MPLPARLVANWSFQAGNLSGLTTAGPCFVLDRMELPGGRGTVKSFAPGPFAVIDDVRAANADGERRPSADAPDKAPADTSGFSVRVGRDVLWGIDGAWMELDGVQVDPGESLRFMWKFISPPSLPALEDFALFLVRPDGGDWTEPLGSPFARTFDLATNSYDSPTWDFAVWQPPGTFRGRIRWLCSNGYRRRFADGPPTAAQRRAGASFPASLLIDAIRID